MNTELLRQRFLEEHKRDKKYTILNFLLILAFIGIVVGLLYYFGVNFSSLFENFTGGGDNANSEYSWWYKLILPIVAICIISYPFYKLWKLSKRPSEIEDLLNRIDNGAKASNVSDYIDYKITLPLGKLNVKLVPVNFAMIYLDVDSKSYQFPIPKVYMADLKLYLSGANMEKLNDIREALYSKDMQSSAEKTSVEQEIVMTPIKPIEEFKSFLDSELKGDLEGMEKTRQSSLKMIMIVVPLVLLLMGGLIYYFYSSTMEAQAAEDYNGSGSTKYIIGFFVVALIGSFAYSRFIKSKYTTNSKGGVVGMENSTEGAAGGGDFKQRIFKRMVKFVNPTLEYAPIGHIGLPEFLESGLFEKKSYDINGSDQIMGRHNGVPFIMCDLQVTCVKTFSDEKEGPDEVFTGQYFVARFNKRFSNPVYIKPKTGVKGFFIDNYIGNYVSVEGSKVMLEDPEFMDMFNVYSTDQIGARYILTPSAMERIKELAKRTKGQFYIAFTNNKITVANNSKKDNFEVGMGFAKSYTKNDHKMLLDFYTDLTDQFALIDELRLNVKIWGN